MEKLAKEDLEERLDQIASTFAQEIRKKIAPELWDEWLERHIENDTSGFDKAVRAKLYGRVRAILRAN
jgi:hypothetical protein